MIVIMTKFTVSQIFYNTGRETSSNPFKYKVKATQIQKSTWRYLKTWIISFYLSYISLFVPLMPLFFTVHGLVSVYTPNLGAKQRIMIILYCILWYLNALCLMLDASVHSHRNAQLFTLHQNWISTYTSWPHNIYLAIHDYTAQSLDYIQFLKALLSIKDWHFTHPSIFVYFSVLLPLRIIWRQAGTTCVTHKPRHLSL